MHSDDETAADFGTVPDGAHPSLVAAIPYASGHRRAQIVLGLFGVGLLLGLAMLVCNLQQYHLMEQIGRKLPVTKEQIAGNDNWQRLLFLARLPWYLLTIVAFLIWIHRAHRNLPSLGATDLEFSPRGAVGWYFAPFLNLFKPYQVMREISNASNPDFLSADGSAWRGRNAPAAVKFWWALFLFMNVFGRAVGKADAIADTTGAFQFVAAASMLVDAITIAAMLAAVWVVWLVDRRQAARAAILGLT